MSFPRVVPPSTVGSDTGFAYDYIERGVFLSAPTLKLLAEKLREFRSANGYEEGTPELDVGRFNGAKLGKPIDPDQPSPETWLTIKAREIAGGEAEFVDQEESQRRAEICANCDLNRPNMSPCAGCRNTQERMVTLLTQGKYQSPLRLQRCSALGYSLKLAVLLGEKNLEMTSKAKSELPSYCWRSNLHNDKKTTLRSGGI